MPSRYPHGIGGLGTRGSERGNDRVVVAPGSPAGDDTSNATLIRQVEELVAEGIRLDDACGAVAKSHGRRKRDLYQAVVAAREEA